MLFEKKLKREETKEFNLKLTRTERDKHGQAQKAIRCVSQYLEEGGDHKGALESKKREKEKVGEATGGKAPCKIRFVYASDGDADLHVRVLKPVSV